MRLIELVGPPAVGKSTIVAAALRDGLLDARASVLSPRSVLVAPLAPRLRGIAGRRSRFDRLARRLLIDPDEARIEAALAALGPDWAPFLELVLDGPTGERPPTALAVMERVWLLRALQLRAVLEIERREHDQPQPPGRRGDPMLVLDEGLTHPYKAIAAVGSSDAAIERYAATVPLPDVLIVVDDDGDVIARRLQARLASTPGRARPQALGTDSERLVDEVRRTQQIVRLVAEHAADRGAEVITLDAAGASPERLAAELVRRAGVTR